MTVVEVQSAKDFDAATSASSSSPPSVVYFWATWCEPCKGMDTVVDVLSRQYGDRVAFLRVEAEREDLEDITDRYDVASVPHFVFLGAGGQAVDALEGADAPGLTAKVAKLAGGPPPAAAPEGAAPADPKAALHARLEKIIRSAPVVLFMKGSPEEPRCGFSRKAVGLLGEAGARFAHFDILTDDAVRQGLKEYSDWPTYPQLYVDGELLGGFDIIQEMHDKGELKPAVTPSGPTPGPASHPAAAASNGNGGPSLEARLRGLIASSPVMLFMKGDRDGPQCGFSARVVAALNGTGVSYGKSKERLSARECACECEVSPGGRGRVCAGDAIPLCCRGNAVTSN